MKFPQAGAPQKSSAATCLSPGASDAKTQTMQQNRPPAPPFHLALVNGRVLPLAEAAVSVNDAAVLTGLAVFESMRLDEGRVFAAGHHWARLQAGAGKLGLKPPAAEELQAAVSTLIHAAGLTRARLRLTLSAGTSAPGGRGGTASGGEVLSLFAVPLPQRAPEISLVTSPWRRNPDSPLAGVKCTAWAENVLALRHADLAGAGEALMLNTRGELCECAASNLFLVKQHPRTGALRLLTPPLSSGCLPGITRALVLGLAAQTGISSREETLLPADLETASEVFITSTFRGVQPVTSLDGRLIPAGPVAQRLHAALEHLRAPGDA